MNALDKFKFCEKFIEYVSEEYHCKMSVNVDIFDEIMHKTLDKMRERETHDCVDCIYVYCNCAGNCNCCELYETATSRCKCPDYIEELLPCPYFKKNTNND